MEDRLIHARDIILLDKVLYHVGAEHHASKIRIASLTKANEKLKRQKIELEEERQKNAALQLQID
jgi:hypothetical protein